MQEHRGFKRIAEEHLISFKVMAEDHHTVADQGMAVEQNLSRSGLQLELPVEVKVGDWMELSLAVVEKIVDVSGEVVWVTQRGKRWCVGFKLVSFPHQDQDMIRSWWCDFTEP